MVIVHVVVFFRVPYFTFQRPSTIDSGLLNFATDGFVKLVLERQALIILPILYGVGVAMMSEKYQNGIYWILSRRFLFLLLLGLFHIFFVFTEDVLTLLALCGLCIIPFVRARSWALTGVLVLCFLTRALMPWPQIQGNEQFWIETTQSVYGSGTYRDIFNFRLMELKQMILPIQLGIWPRTMMLMCGGILVWRKNGIALLRHTRAGLAVGWLGLFIWALTMGVQNFLVRDVHLISLGISCSIFFLRCEAHNVVIKSLAVVGRMSLTVYLTHTVLFGFIFYSYGLAFYGKVGSFVAALMGIGFYGGMVIFAKWYFSKFTQGPVERLWRRLTYLR